MLKTIVVICALIPVFDILGFQHDDHHRGAWCRRHCGTLAAQQTIANVFGGVSVIGDAPVLLGDYGNFGGVMGTVEQIGLRSARIRTLNRTVAEHTEFVVCGRQFGELRVAGQDFV